MPAKRHDHFSGTGDTASSSPHTVRLQAAPEGNPPVTPWLIEHLETVFCVFVPGGHPTSMDDLVALSSSHSEAVGQRAVIDYLKRLLEEQQNPNART